MNELILAIVIFTAIVLVFPIVYFFVGKQVREMNADNTRQLQKQGYVIDYPILSSSHTQMTRIWQLLDTPTPFYVYISSLDPIASAAGMLGLADLKIGNHAFDNKFVLRTNNEALLKRMLTPELQEELLAWDRICFKTGAIVGILSVDYLPEMTIGRDERRLWMIETFNKRQDNEIKRLLQLGYKLRDATLTAANSWQGPKNITVSFFEGR